MRSENEKFKTIIEKNTFYFYDPFFQEQYESHLNSLKETLLLLKNKIENHQLQKSHFVQLLAEREQGLPAILALTGISKEFFKRLVTIVRVAEDKELAALTYKENWCANDSAENLSEWSDSKIKKLVQTNGDFRAGVVNIFFEGAANPFLAKTLPLFELKKLGIQKMGFDPVAMIDTLIRYKEKGSYAGKSENNSEKLIAGVLADLDLSFESGDLKELVKNASNTKRTMDFVIPSKVNPRIIIESSFLTTTSSGQGDKAKTEIGVAKLIKRYIPTAKFIGFVDGIGWYVRKQDLKRMISAFDDVFTFERSELDRFSNFITKEARRW
jgi:hypothetical protein